MADRGSQISKNNIQAMKEAFDKHKPIATWFFIDPFSGGTLKMPERIQVSETLNSSCSIENRGPFDVYTGVTVKKLDRRD